VAACRAEDAALRSQLAELGAATDAAREARFAMDAKRVDAEQVCLRFWQYIKLSMQAPPVQLMLPWTLEECEEFVGRV
jgi:hypothetical protein